MTDFLTDVGTANLPRQTIDHAAMLIASATCGTALESTRIIRGLACERGGRADASLWFDDGAKLPVADAA